MATNKVNFDVSVSFSHNRQDDWEKICISIDLTTLKSTPEKKWDTYLFELASNHYLGQQIISISYNKEALKSLSKD